MVHQSFHVPRLAWYGIPVQRNWVHQLDRFGTTETTQCTGVRPYSCSLQVYDILNLRILLEDLLTTPTGRVKFENLFTLRAETFAGVEFRVFRVFWSFSRKFLPLEIINHQNAKVFSCEITNIFQTRKFFWQVTNSCSNFSRENSWKFFPRMTNLWQICPNAKVFVNNFRVFFFFYA